MRRHGTPQTHRKIYLDWDDSPDAAGYIMLFSRQPDSVYEIYGDLKKTDTDALFQIAGKHTEYYFIVVPKDEQGVWLKRSKDAKAEFSFEDTDEESGN